MARRASLESAPLTSGVRGLVAALVLIQHVEFPRTTGKT